MVRVLGSITQILPDLIGIVSFIGHDFFGSGLGPASSLTDTDTLQSSLEKYRIMPLSTT